jgi:hypothetical protein
MVHVKGLKRALRVSETTFTPFEQVFPNLTDVGAGDMIDWRRIFAESSHAGIKHYGGFGPGGGDCVDSPPAVLRGLYKTSSGTLAG